MNTKKNTIKLISTYIIGFVVLVLASFGVLKFKNNINNINNVNAYGVNGIESKVTNANFDDDSTSSYPDKSFSGFTAYNHNKPQSSYNTDENVKAGVIDLSVDEWENKFPYAANESWNSKKNKVLMIDSTTEKDGVITKHDAKYGYRTNSPIKMDADSRYMVTVYVYTATDAGIASIYLYDNEGEEFSSFKGINSHNDFTAYTFFVKTNNTQSLELTLGLYLEGAGSVLFDNIHVEKLSESEYDFVKSSTPTNTYKEINKVDNIVANYFVNNDNELENTEDNTDKSSFDEIESGNKTIRPITVDDSDGNYTKALLLKNPEKEFAQYSTKKDFLTFDKNTIYRVSFNVKTKNLDGTAFLKLVRTDIAKKDYEKNNYSEDLNKTIKITSNTYSSTEESVSNDYKTYSFLINSHPSQSVSYQLIIGLGIDDESLTSGEMYVSGIEISKINYSDFNSASTGSGNEKINLVDAYDYDNAKIFLANGEFDAFKIADYNNPMPATPISWDVTTGKHTQEYGVINENNDNVLMMHNLQADTLSYKSASKNLEAKSYHKFEVDVKTLNAPLKLSLVTKKDDTEVELSSITVSSNSWQTVTLLIYTGYQPVDVSLKLTLTSSADAYAYVDSAKFDYPSNTYSTVEEQYKATHSSTYTVVTDLTKLLETSSTENFATPTYFSANKVAGVEKAGIITLDPQHANHLDEVIYSAEDLEQFTSLAPNNVLGIRATEDVYYTMKSNIGYKLTTGEDKYYKITVSVFTQNIDTNNKEIDKSTIGASIKLSGFDDTFTKIQSQGRWTNYTFYIKPNSDITTYIELSIGDAETVAKGDVFFGNIEFVENVSSDEFNNATSSLTTKIITKTTEPEDNKEEETETTKEDNTNKNLWLYLIPSILTAAAIIIAVVGIAVRKIKWKKPTKKTKNVYDRNKTVSVQYYTRKATTLREEKIRELTADLDKISAQRKTYEDEYKQDLTKLREMKIKRANPVDITKLEKDMKKNQKLSANLGVTANKIANDLEYAKTDAYLNSLMKKLQRENVSIEEKQNEDTKNKK